MSAPELPPISDRGGHGGAPRGDKRKTSVNSLNSSGSKASTSHPAHVINGKSLTPSKVNYTASNGLTSHSNTTSSTKKKKGQLPRNYSDPSLTQLPGNSSTVSHDSSSTNLSQSTANGVDGHSGSGPRHIKFLSKSNRALSWCATDNLGSQGKLETLFEGQANHNNNHPNYNLNNANVNHLSTSPTGHNPARYSLNKTSSNGSSTNLISLVSNANAVNNNNITDMPPIAPQPATAAGHRSRKDVARRQSFTKKADDGGALPDSPRGRRKRSDSENKLAHSQDFISESQQRAVQRVEARNFSVDRIARHASPPRPHTKYVGPAPHAKSRLHRSVTALNVDNSNHNNGHEAQLQGGDDAFGDDESYEKNARVFKWVIDVSNVEEFDTDPKDTYVEYTDETPQTDTAIHLVYSEQ
ncbi:unnamed protein product [Lymnaea stagnalis]|uniref:Uncharacterized protein n=1 Tax=Lymnaea stagnalis TaxID=6523 RepID=A0AAV2IN69_LYMST